MWNGINGEIKSQVCFSKEASGEYSQTAVLARTPMVTLIVKQNKSDVLALHRRIRPSAEHWGRGKKEVYFGSFFTAGSGGSPPAWFCSCRDRDLLTPRSDCFALFLSLPLDILGKSEIFFGLMKMEATWVKQLIPNPAAFIALLTLIDLPFEVADLVRGLVTVRRASSHSCNFFNSSGYSSLVLLSFQLAHLQHRSEEAWFTSPHIGTQLWSSGVRTQRSLGFAGLIMRGDERSDKERFFLKYFDQKTIIEPHKLHR